MPYVWVGLYSFDMAEVILVKKTGGRGEDGVTVTLRPSTTFDLAGREAEAFLAAWAEHTAALPIERGPPGVLTPKVVSRRADADAAGNSHR